MDRPSVGRRRTEKGVRRDRQRRADQRRGGEAGPESRCGTANADPQGNQNLEHGMLPHCRPERTHLSDARYLYRTVRALTARPSRHSQAQRA